MKSCDLLSNCIFNEFYHIFSVNDMLPGEVVICFQIVSLTSSITSEFGEYNSRFSCDLLSNCIFNEFYHIIRLKINYDFVVVICFQIVSLTSSITSR